MQEDIPSVGTYFPLNDTIAENVRKKAEIGSSSSMNLLYSDRSVVPFASSEIWFKQSRLDENLRFIGPGYYENKTFIENLKLKPSTNAAGFNSKDSRFQKTSGFKKESKNLPGPAHYNTGESEKWIKPTFNMIFSD